MLLHPGSFRGLAASAAIIVVMIMVYTHHTSEWRIFNRGSISNELHPIDRLMLNAEKEFNALISKETFDLRSAAAAYRERRGRHPPPGFNAWFTYAKQHNAIIVEDFWDQIYHDITPLWALSPREMRRDVRANMRDDGKFINVRNGKATTESDFWWGRIWCDLINTFASHLPDMDISFNKEDEPRLTVKWEDMNDYVRDERATRRMPKPSDVISEYSGVSEGAHDETTDVDLNWIESGPNFPLTRVACPPDSPARQAQVVTDFSETPVIDLQYVAAHTYKGYVSNYTLSTSICHQPDLQRLHGILIASNTLKSSTHLFPLFSGSKLATNNDLLLPAAIPYASFTHFTTDDAFSWEEKETKVVWRGAATGGRVRTENWKGFHRHRFVAMMNATQIRRAENWIQSPLNWVFPSNPYNVKAACHGRLGDWVKTFADVGFVEVSCDGCDPWFSQVPVVELTDQFRNKFLIDVDGHGFSGRYRSFLLSNSLPVKATLFREWHDSRLVAWKHFVPMDNRFGDLYGILEYFLGYDEPDHPLRAHDETARKMAEDGRDWGQQVLRREDMEIYTLRLLLEYARVIDDRRDVLGFVDDVDWRPAREQ